MGVTATVDSTSCCLRTELDYGQTQEFNLEAVMLINSSPCLILLLKHCTFAIYGVCVSAPPACVFSRCQTRTVMKQRRLKSAAGGWKWTWESLRCEETQSPFAAPLTRYHHSAHRAPALMLAPLEEQL